MSRCDRCHARIPIGRNYCHPHYQEALREHERAVVHYQHERQAWEALAPDERRRRDEEAEAIEVTVHTFFTGLGLGGLAWYGVHLLYPIDGLLGLVMVAAVTTATLNWAPLRGPLGRLTRALVKAAPGVLGSTLMCLALALVSDWVADHWQGIALITGGLIVAGSLLMELQGQYRTTGEPQIPVEPRL